MSAEPLTEGAQLVLALVFALSAVEKGAALLARTARWHPVVIAHPRLRRRAAPLMAAALVADVAAVICLLLVPAAGAPLAAGALVAYTYLGARVDYDHGGSCRCVSKGFDAKTRRALLVRNAYLGALAVAVAASPPALHASGLFPAAVLAVVLALIVAALNRSGAPTDAPAPTPVLHIKEGI